MSFCLAFIVKKILADARKEPGKEKFGALERKALLAVALNLENLRIPLQKDST